MREGGALWPWNVISLGIKLDAFTVSSKDNVTVPVSMSRLNEAKVGLVVSGVRTSVAGLKEARPEM